MRNMEKIAQKMQGQFNSRTGLTHYDMDSEHMSQLIRQCMKGPDQAFEAISTAFKYGFVMGNHATVNGRVKGRL